MKNIYHQIELDLLDAIRSNHLLLFFQPKVNLQFGTVSDFEALIRWNHPAHGLMLPRNFLPQVRAAGLAVELGEWVLESAVKQLVAWDKIGFSASISVNIDPEHLCKEGFYEFILNLLAIYKLHSLKRLEIEITESSRICNISKARNAIEKCKSRGISFALDDFGVGYASLYYLKQLSFDTIKIDKIFVKNIIKNQKDLEIVRMIINLGYVFDTLVVAEGVTSFDIAKKLIGIGCRVGQGFYLRLPMPSHKIIPWHKNYRS